MHVMIQIYVMHDTNVYHTMAWYQCMYHVTPWHGTYQCMSQHGMGQFMSHYMVWHQCMSHYSMVPTCHGTNARHIMTCYTMAWYQYTYNACHTIWHGINACYTMAWSNACHTIPWYQCMSHYCMILIYTHHTMEWYQIMACYQCMSHYGMVSMHVTLWHGANLYHTMV